MSSELIAALVGASAALIGQLIGAVFNQRSLTKQVALSEKQIALSAEMEFITRKLDALVVVRDALHSLYDGDTDAKSAYFLIRPNLIFLDSSTEKVIVQAIETTIRPKKSHREEQAAITQVEEALETLRSESITLWSKYHG